MSFFLKYNYSLGEIHIPHKSLSLCWILIKSFQYCNWLFLPYFHLVFTSKKKQRKNSLNAFFTSFFSYRKKSWVLSWVYLHRRENSYSILVIKFMLDFNQKLTLSQMIISFLFVLRICLKMKLQKKNIFNPFF